MARHRNPTRRNFYKNFKFIVMNTPLTDERIATLPDNDKLEHMIEFARKLELALKETQEDSDGFADLVLYHSSRHISNEVKIGDLTRELEKAAKDSERISFLEQHHGLLTYINKDSGVDALLPISKDTWRTAIDIAM